MSEDHAPQKQKAAASPTALGRAGQLVARLGEGRRPIIVALVVYGVLLIALNTRVVSISLVFFTIHTELLVLIAVSGLVGFLCGYLVRRHRDTGREDS